MSESSPIPHLFRSNKTDHVRSSHTAPLHAQIALTENLINVGNETVSTALLKGPSIKSVVGIFAVQGVLTAFSSAADSGKVVASLGLGYGINQTRIMDSLEDPKVALAMSLVVAANYTTTIFNARGRNEILDEVGVCPDLRQTVTHKITRKIFNKDEHKNRRRILNTSTIVGVSAVVDGIWIFGLHQTPIEGPVAIFFAKQLLNTAIGGGFGSLLNLGMRRYSERKK